MNGDAAAFHEYLERRRRRGYAANAYNLELLGIECDGEPETVEQKYTRLLNEVRELQDMVSASLQLSFISPLPDRPIKRRCQERRKGRRRSAHRAR